ncbi:hypothetical protein AK812_SmicGene11240 [Symbiodinium microadriaticum]|uniref:Uncharacterized protein n=1 Tax=Symbiodinium microadriaticum TaxID=2951 RepID=A0A1Q9EDR0_SYMMI|nr:hypothetical protein AK812_SmicGene11240 [Symbiodinium microadriaticum]
MPSGWFLLALPEAEGLLIQLLEGDALNAGEAPEGCSGCSGCRCSLDSDDAETPPDTEPSQGPGTGAWRDVLWVLWVPNPFDDEEVARPETATDVPVLTVVKMTQKYPDDTKKPESMDSTPHVQDSPQDPREFAVLIPPNMIRIMKADPF